VSSVLYTRLSGELKQALAEHARKRGLSLNAAACELIAAGLAAGEEEQAGDGLRRELAARSSELAQTKKRLTEAKLRLQAAREREELTARTYRALAERARGELAVCPQCRTPLRGSDLLVCGRCPNCARPITALLLPRPQSGAPERDAYLALLGALGGLLGLALAGSGERTS
jgi:rubrerythrin